MLKFIRTYIFALWSILAIAAHLAIAPSVNAGPALLFEATTGKVLYAENPDHQWHPASLTKIMTAYIAFEEMKAGRLTANSKLMTTKEAHKMEPSKIGLPIGAELGLDLALKSLIIKSANDVSVMFAQKISGSVPAFADRMNATAKRLGMTRTNFANPNGLPHPAQVTTARDLAKLSRAIVRDFPEHAHFFSMPRFRIGKRTLGSHNTLLKTFAGADGLKTGFICDSGYNVVASATRDGRKLMAVVLGEPSGRERGLRAASLLEHGFQKFGWKTLFNSTTIDNLPIQPDAARVHSIRNTVNAWVCKSPAQRREIRARLRKNRKLRRVRKKKFHRARTAAKRKIRSKVTKKK
ncbi:MAG: D-alanyl-D-alanine carboxypeptidase family protein [Hyphomicrobiaceae bacterium]